MQLEGPTAAGLMYSDTGGDGPVVVLLHGVLMNGTLWDTVVGGLRDRYRCIVPDQNAQLVWIDDTRTLIPIDNRAS